MMLTRTARILLAILSSYGSMALAEKLEKIDPAQFDQTLLSEAYRFVDKNYGSQLDPTEYREIRILWSNERQTYHLRIAYDDPDSTISGATIFVFCQFSKDRPNVCGTKQAIPPQPPEIIDLPVKDEDSDEAPTVKSNIPLQKIGPVRWAGRILS